MSFISVLKKIGSGFGKVLGAVEPVLSVAAPVISAWNPGIGAMLTTIDSLVTGVEGMVTTAKQGNLKKQTVTQIALSELPQLQAVIDQFGTNVQIPQTELSDLIDASVALYNKAALLTLAIEAKNKLAAPSA